MPEEDGGPFVTASARSQYGSGTDESNPEDAEREPSRRPIASDTRRASWRGPPTSAATSRCAEAFSPRRSPRSPRAAASGSRLREHGDDRERAHRRWLRVRSLGDCAELSYSDTPSDGVYYLTTFGGGSDTQPMACGGTTDGTSAYVADEARFGWARSSR